MLLSALVLKSSSNPLAFLFTITHASTCLSKAPDWRQTINPSRNALLFFQGLLGGADNPLCIEEKALAQSHMYKGEEFNLWQVPLYTGKNRSTGNPTRI